MRIDPMLAELRRDPAPQLSAQAALERCRDAWRAAPAAAALLSEFEDYGRGAALAECPLLDCTLAEPERARALLDALVTPMARSLRANALGHVPFRHQYSPGLAVLQLASAGRATLSLVCYEGQPDTRALAETVCFADGERHELCLAGAADTRLFEILREERGRADLECERRRIAAGERLMFSGSRHTRIVDAPLGRLVILRLARGAASPVPAREYRIADGTLIHCASGDRGESRDEMAAAVLGAMRRGDAVPVLAAIAGEEAGGSEHLRWQALCQALALNTAAGFALLTDRALDPTDPLAEPAGALRATLIERHPELSSWSPRCRALIDCPDAHRHDVAACLDMLGDGGFDPQDEASVAHAALALRRLGNDRTFLGDLLIAQLKDRHRDIGESSAYGAQSVVLSAPRGGCFLRANIWPSERDACFRSSGAKTFVYGLPHDHNFSFLTVGYLGPGYASDYYEYDYEAAAGYAGETRACVFVERSALGEGKLMLYRAHRDIHSQLPAKSLSVSLNIMRIHPAEGWFDQYGFDLDSGAITRVLNPTSSETFLRCVVGLGGPEALDLAEHFGRNHFSDRMRLASFEARALLLDGAAADELWREAELSGSVMVAKEASARRLTLAG